MITEILKLIAEKGPMLCVAYSRIMRHGSEPSNNSYDSTKKNRIIMNEDFITYELAVKLKEKGFREKCIAYYWEKINEHTPSFSVEDNMPEDGLNILDLLSNHNQIEWSPFIDAPTISQVLKWLRKEKKYHIEFVGNACGYLFIVSDIPEKGGTDRYCSDYSGPNDGGTWDKYEDCALAAIEYVLDNLI